MIQSRFFVIILLTQPTVDKLYNPVSYVQPKKSMIATRKEGIVMIPADKIISLRKKSGLITGAVYGAVTFISNSVGDREKSNEQYN